MSLTMNTLKTDEISLYIHIPFCVEKCLYCDFISYKISDAEKHNSVEIYVQALKKEIDLYETLLRDSKVSTIFIGGGTPSSIEGRYILEIINQIKQYNALLELKEFTIEINPGTLNDEKINAYLAAGVNRVSMGVQSAEDTLLKSIGRIHTFNEFLTTYRGIREKGFDNVNLDLMFGLPNQSIADVEHTLKIITELNPEHISAYALKLEEGTPLYRAHKRGEIVLPDEETERAMYHLIENILEEKGYVQYEISNFAKPNKASNHNLVYWENKSYLGLGIASHSKVGSLRFSNFSNFPEYINALNQNTKPVNEETPIEKDEDLFETIMLGLRLNKGIAIEAINKKYEIDFLEKYQHAIEKLKSQKLILHDIEAKQICLTPLGRDLSNQVFLEFMPD
ncbi:radical SAM family heme chaperone HemW [Fusibacter ferrireducens]|uniref:Heme chaperone HemW n=1 Tax=Fusibacter ferrireducens TaxID=2785058 RepID=A0ABR9ZY65_9FIRM|nr:radical SAM family heme chaperone HemW [Fusibacter ferrireducens]MBF4694906.1 radical SAM family heme chaperone HemW [Fusibacter ferrireducens]